MIQAIFRNKIKSEVREYFKTKEDTLTSSIIGNMLFLPTKFFLELLSNASYEKFSYSHFGVFQSYEFWPHWNSENTFNSNYVEPDVFLRFENIDLIIEAKRYDDSQQYRKQWENEIVSYYNMYENDQKELIFLAIGGINTIKTESIPVNNNEVKIYKIRWKKILSEIESVYKNIEKVKSYSENTNSIIRILKVIIQSFELHGFLSTMWFKDFKVQFNINDYSINNWQPNKNHFFHFKNKYQINQKIINQWEQ